MNPRDAGFTLIETLVALAVLAVAAAGLLRATQAHVDTIGRLETRVTGRWAAENALVEARLGLPSPPTILLGHRWRTTLAVRPSSDPDINAVTVTATESGGATVVLRGFVDTGRIAGAVP